MPPYACPDERIIISSMPSWKGPPDHHLSYDCQLAAMYICMWSLASGRWLRDDIPPDQLSEDELIAFWADDLTASSGRNA